LKNNMNTGRIQPKRVCCRVPFGSRSAKAAKSAPAPSHKRLLWLMFQSLAESDAKAKLHRNAGQRRAQARVRRGHFRAIVTEGQSGNVSLVWANPHHPAGLMLIPERMPRQVIH
jgi:hypothetical protein